MINENFIYLALAFNIFGSASYIIATLKGKAKPNKVSWLMWAISPLVAFFAQLSKGVGISSLMTFAVGFGPLLVFIVSFFSKESEWKITKFDLFCGFLSSLGIIFWVLTREANIAIFFSIFADFAAGIPTLIKSFYFPETEEYKAYLFAGISAFITLLTIPAWEFAYYGFPVLIFAYCFAVTALIKLKIGKFVRKVI